MRQHLFTLAIAIFISYLLIQWHSSTKQPPESINSANTAFERVMQTRTLRCGYVVYYPGLVKDVNTGKFSGFDYDIVTSIAQNLNIKVEWTEEVGWANALEGFRTNRYDALCVGMWTKPVYSQHALYVKPNFYQPIFGVSRIDDMRFDKDLNTINDSGIKIAAIDGDAPVYIAAEDFPKATVSTLSNMTQFNMVLEEVKVGKADVTMIDAPTFGEYATNNPNFLKLLQPDNPIRIMPCAMAVGLGEHNLRALLDASVDYLVLSGGMDRILDRYEKYPHSFIRQKRPN